MCVGNKLLFFTTVYCTVGAQYSTLQSDTRRDRRARSERLEMDGAGMRTGGLRKRALRAPIIEARL